MISLVPISVLIQTETKKIRKTHNQGFLLNGVLSLEMATVKVINDGIYCLNLKAQDYFFYPLLLLVFKNADEIMNFKDNQNFITCGLHKISFPDANHGAGKSSIANYWSKSKIR